MTNPIERAVERADEIIRWDIELSTPKSFVEPPKLNVYKAGLNGKQIEIHATSLYAAKVAALQGLKPTRANRHLVWVELVQLADGTDVTSVVTS